MNKKNIYIILCFAFTIFVGINYLNTSLKSNLNVGQNSISSISFKEVEQQTNIFKEKQKDIDKLKDQLNQNTIQQIKLNSNKTELDNKVAEVNSQIKKIEVTLSQEEQKLTDLAENSQNFLEQKKIQDEKIENLVLQLKNKNKLLTEVKAETDINTNDLKSTEVLEKTLQSNLENKNLELNNQFTTVVNTTTLLASNYFIYIVLLAIYWIAYKTIRYLIHKDLHNHQFKSVAKITVKVVWIIVSLGTIFYGLAGQLTYILTSLGFVSAALVFALQSFVSSFFVFVVLSITRIFKEGDIIKVGANYEGYTGRIISIGRFYTFIKEINPENHEEVGRTVSIPNSFLLIHPVTNYTFHNKVIWLNLKVTIKAGSDHRRVKQILEYIANEKFKFVKQNLIEYLDLEVNLNDLKPKIFTSLEEKGFMYTIHFPARFDKYNEIYDSILSDIILAFDQENIHFAFKA
jgi:small-conductance mechanosensitive channel